MSSQRGFASESNARRTAENVRDNAAKATIESG
jgi:hypothetical protein